MELTIRKPRHADMDRLLEINESAIPAVNGLTRGQMLWFIENASWFRVAARDGRIVAFMIGLRPGLDYASPNYQWFCAHYDDFGYVDRVVVAESGRRLGIGSRLYDGFAAALDGNVPVMTCEVNIRPPNRSSMDFHVKAGFREVGRQQTEQGNKEVALMEKRLADERN